MIKIGRLAAAALFALASVAHGGTSGQQAQPAAQGAASVEKNLEADKSGGKADKGKVEKSEHPAKSERPASK